MADKEQKKWIFNWKFALVVFGIVVLISPPVNPYSFLGTLVGAIIVGAITGFDETYKFH